MALNKAQKAKLIAVIKANTKAWGEEWNKADKERESLTEKERKVADYLAKGYFGCNNTYVTELMGILLEKDFKSLASKAVKRFVANRFVAVVPVAKFDGHDYVIGEVAVTTKDRQHDGLVTKNGSRGNSLSQGVVSQVRAATDEEIEALPEIQLDTIVELSNILFV